MWSAFLGEAITAAALPIPTAYAVFCVCKQWYGCQRFGFLMCTQMLMQEIENGDCMKMETV